jgi:hypothetical protein
MLGTEKTTTRIEFVRWDLLVAESTLSSLGNVRQIGVQAGAAAGAFQPGETDVLPPLPGCGAQEFVAPFGLAQGLTERVDGASAACGLSSSYLIRRISPPRAGTPPP